jgi:hypothetical protein
VGLLVHAENAGYPPCPAAHCRYPFTTHPNLGIHASALTSLWWPLPVLIERVERPQAWGTCLRHLAVPACTILSNLDDSVDRSPGAKASSANQKKHGGAVQETALAGAQQARHGWLLLSGVKLVRISSALRVQSGFFEISA